MVRENGASARGRDTHSVVIARTTHCAFHSGTEQTVVGKRDLGDAQFDYYNLYLRWYAYWSKGLDNGMASVPKVQIYVMGANKWRSENEWPLARTRFTKYYLHSDGHANSREGHGVLSAEAPRDEASDQFRYDPKNPVPTVGEGPQDQSEVERRADVLVYSTPPLKAGVELTGTIELVLFVGSSARDTDFTAKLVDVYPNGTAFNLQDGVLRARS